MIISLVWWDDMTKRKTVQVEETITLSELKIIAANKFHKKIKTIAVKRSGYNEIFSFISVQPNLCILCSDKIQTGLVSEEDAGILLNTDAEPSLFIFAQEATISKEAINQLYALKKMLNVTLLIGLPDLHCGGKYPIGCTVVTKNNTIYPDLVGTDIGCGMTFIKLAIQEHRLTSNKLEKMSSQLFLDDAVRSQEELNFYYRAREKKGVTLTDLSDNVLLQSFSSSMGTIGRGNHFVELQKVDKIMNEEMALQLGISSEVCYLAVHSGSRGLGEHILQKFQKHLITVEEYKILHDEALEFAKHNRFAIASRFLKCIQSPEEDSEVILDIFHNFVETVGNDTIHRKGSAPSHVGNPVLIPGSRGSRTYLVMPTETNSMANGYSVAHGAGRCISRNKIKEGFKLKTRKDRDFCCQGDEDIQNIVICEPGLFVEEIPSAYKNIEATINDLVSFGLITVIASFVPLITYKCRRA